MDRSELSERDIQTKFITPALVQAGWTADFHLREEVQLTAGQILVTNGVVQRAAKKFADYVLYHAPNIPLAVVEAKDANHAVGAGIQQALGYADLLDVPFMYSSNGTGFIEHDRTAAHGLVERYLELDEFPSPEELWRRYCVWKQLTPNQTSLINQDYYLDGYGKAPRYYQMIAINRTIEAIARGQQRILLVMATGTGKTYTAFQIIWRLWKAKVKKRILFLADRNILVDQARNNDFKPFGNAMTKISNREANTAFEIYLALYQAMSGSEASQNIYRQFSPTFFDLIVIDECHRGSAAEDSAWRQILDYFASATHIGLTATPKETQTISNSDYFGDPLYTYSLKQGIADGFLAPYSVLRVATNVDLEGWRPQPGQRDADGQLIEDRLYNSRDFERVVFLDDRIQLVAARIAEFLRNHDPYQKTIVFCQNIEHAARMRTAIAQHCNEFVQEDARYVMQITGDNPEGKAQLDMFILPDSRYPVVVTTSKLLTTGVDVQTCRLIVIDQYLESMTEFKQIIGRGTRIREDYNKLYFTIMDFRNVTTLFNDPEFDGDPVQVQNFGVDQALPTATAAPPAEAQTTNIRYQIGSGEVVHILAEQVRYYSSDGRLITESVEHFARNTVRQRYTTLANFLQTWSHEAQKQAIVQELAAQGILFDKLAEIVGYEYDPFDLICHVAFDQPALTRRERAEQVRKRSYFAQYGEKARAVIQALLEKYADQGLATIQDRQVLQLPSFQQLGTPREIIQAFGSLGQYQQAVDELVRHLYAA